MNEEKIQNEMQLHADYTDLISELGKLLGDKEKNAEAIKAIEARLDCYVEEKNVEPISVIEDEIKKERLKQELIDSIEAERLDDLINN